MINYTKSVAGAEDTLKEVIAAGGKGVIVQANVGSNEDCLKLAAECVKAFGRIDFLVVGWGRRVEFRNLRLIGCVGRTTRGQRNLMTTTTWTESTPRISRRFTRSTLSGTVSLSDLITRGFLTYLDV